MCLTIKGILFGERRKRRYKYPRKDELKKKNTKKNTGKAPAKRSNLDGLLFTFLDEVILK